MTSLRKCGYLAAMFVIGATVPAMADTVLFDRGLPTANINAISDATRSDIAVGYGATTSDGYYFTGDDFTIAGSGQFVINTVRTWAIAGSPGTNLSTLFTNVTLYGGTAAGGVSALTTGTVGGSNPNIVITPVQFTGSANYKTPGTNFDLQLWQIDFTNLNWVVNANELMQFGVDGTLTSTYENSDPQASWFNLATNASLAGSTQQGSDNQFRSFATGLLSDGNQGFDSYPLGSSSIGSDMNVQIFGASYPAPEPASFALIGCGALLLLRRRTTHA
jgi:hypothetical protein